MKILKRKTLAALLALSLLASLLPLGAQPALAVAPIGQVLYVGGVQISSTGYWTTDSDGNVIASTAGETPTDNYIHYDAENNVLTLHNATIKNELEFNESIEGGTYINGSAIGVFNQSGNAELTISLVGTNTIANVGKGIFVLASSASTGSSNLTIQGDGSLNASASQTGIWVQSNGNNAALCVENAEVTASSGDPFKNGVLVQAKDGSDVSLTVNGGSLTASVNANIWFQFGSGVSGSGTPTVTVSKNAIVRANGGIANNSSTSIQYGTGNEENGGIVFDGKNGTVYGKVELQEDLTIGEGESLTIGKDASLNTGSHEVIVNGGTLTGGDKIEGTVKYAPTITTQPTSQTVTEGETATFTVVASGTEPLSYQWQQSTDKGSSWTNIDSATNTTYTTGKTTMDMNDYQYRCVVTGSAGSVTSSAATLTINAPTTYTITAAASPADGGTVDGNGDYVEGSSVTLNATANSGYRFVGWVEGDQTVSTDTTYAFNADGNRTLTAKFEKVYNVTVNSKAGGTATADKTTAAAGETVSLTANPNSGYRFTGWTFSDNVIGADVSSKTTSFTMPDGDVTATANFAKIPSVTPSTPPTVSEETIDAIKAADPGETVTVDLSSGDTTLDKDVFETLAGKDVTLVVDLGDGVSWTVNGSDVPEDADFTDIDMGVTMNSDGIPVNVINTITGEVGTVQITLAHNGEFGFTMTLTAPLGKENAGYWANLYHYDEEAEAMNFEAAAKIDEDGSVTIPFSHASQYAIVIDTHSHATVDVSDLFIDIAPDAWYKDAIQYAYDNGLMTGVSATEFAPEATTTRAMIVSILARLENVTTAQAAGFADVDDNDWYATAVNWAANVGVVNGYEDNTFRPNTAITREQLAAILMNYAAYKGYDVSARADLSHYSDADSISSWANDVLLWAVAEGLLTGVTDDTIAPQAHATRAQVAAILQRFLAQ